MSIVRRLGQWQGRAISSGCLRGTATVGNQPCINVNMQGQWSRGAISSKNKINFLGKMPPAPHRSFHIRFGTCFSASPPPPKQNLNYPKIYMPIRKPTPPAPTLFSTKLRDLRPKSTNQISSFRKLLAFVPRNT